MPSSAYSVPSPFTTLYALAGSAEGGLGGGTGMLTSPPVVAASSGEVVWNATAGADVSVLGVPAAVVDF